MSGKLEYMSGKPMEETVDALIIGAGHNGLVAAALLAKEGLSVLVVEDKDVIGGCVRQNILSPKFRGWVPQLELISLD